MAPDIAKIPDQNGTVVSSKCSASAHEAEKRNGANPSELSL